MWSLSIQTEALQLKPQKLQQQIQQKDEIIKQKDQQLQQKDQQLNQKDQRLRQQNQEVQQKVQQLHQQVKQKGQQLQQQEQQLVQQGQDAQQKDQQLRQQDRYLRQQDQQLQQKDQQLHQQYQQLQQKEQQIRQQEQEILQKDHQILQVQEDYRGERANWVVRRQEITTSEKLLGTGGWGSVREGIFRGYKVAVKSIDNEIISQYNLELFSREMDMAARCRHPNLMQFIAATDEAIPQIVTELMHTSLRKILQQGQLYSNQIIPILLGVACGLNYLHKTTPSPILHRDISSANVLLNPLPNNQWHPKLSDFGSANFMRTSHTVGAGNPSYAAPEALKPEGPHTPAMDVFSFGVLMYEMCSRRFPTEKPNPSMLSHVKWDVTETKLVGMIRSCLSDEIKGRPSMDYLIFGLNR